MSSKFISISISPLVAYNPKIPVSNVIQEVQILFQTGCTYKRAWYATKFTIEGRPQSYNLQSGCGKWQAYTLPCSHALAVCRKNGTRADTYMPNIYSRETYRRTYQSHFHPVGLEKFWRDAPYNLTFHPPNMNNERGRKQGTRFRGEMDYRNLDSPPRCDRCRMPGHNIKNCNNPVQAMYNFVF
ncbi:hypothetical protein M9H77_34522 [Catharanthus roseus]|uniref:Uncharacterized protein n=1 Tax=Catharanthus roseus TaxID=4058 RepID=A0ACB9ZLF1_CATRO|nr:hypothetical protein M9H77_34522 [Catharanthus roseus]